MPGDLCASAAGGWPADAAIIGSVIAGYLLPRIGIHLGTGFIRSVISAFIGTCLLLTIVRSLS